MKVAFDVGPVRAQPTGVGIYASAMASALSAVLPANQLHLIGRRADASGLPEQLRSRTRDGGPYPLWVLFKSASDAKRVGGDIVHYSDGILPLARHGRSVLTVHDFSTIRQWQTHRAPRWLRIPLVLLSPRLADLVIVPSRATADEVVSLCQVPASRIEIVPYAPQKDLRPADEQTLAAVLQRCGLEPHNYILALGTVEPRKNHLRLIQAFEELVSTGSVRPEIQLVIAGKPGWGSERVTRAMRESRAANRIHVLGYVDGKDLSALLSGAGVVAYVSLYEGFGLPILEAMACGAPTVTSNISSMPEVAGDAAFLVDPFDVKDISRGLLEALRAGTTSRQSISAAARRQASTFSWTKAAEQVADLYSNRL